MGKSAHRASSVERSGRSGRLHRLFDARLCAVVLFAPVDLAVSPKMPTAWFGDLQCPNLAASHAAFTSFRRFRWSRHGGDRKSCQCSHRCRAVLRQECGGSAVCRFERSATFRGKRSTLGARLGLFFPIDFARRGCDARPSLAGQRFGRFTGRFRLLLPVAMVPAQA